LLADAFRLHGAVDAVLAQKRDPTGAQSVVGSAEGDGRALLAVELGGILEFRARDEDARRRRAVLAQTHPVGEERRVAPADLEGVALLDDVRVERALDDPQRLVAPQPVVPQAVQAHDELGRDTVRAGDARERVAGSDLVGVVGGRRRGVQVELLVEFAEPEDEGLGAGGGLERRFDGGDGAAKVAGGLLRGDLAQCFFVLRAEAARKAQTPDQNDSARFLHSSLHLAAIRCRAFSPRRIGALLRRHSEGGEDNNNRRRIQGVAGAVFFSPAR